MTAPADQPDAALRPGAARALPAEAGWLLWANLALLPLWPLAWSAPLLRTGLLPFLEGDTVSVFSGLQALWAEDIALALLVGILGVLMPLAKTVALAAVHAGRLGPRALPALEVLGKLSMADVFLLALMVVAAKGVGLGRVEPEWGLHLFAGCVLLSMLLSHLTARRLRSL